MTIRLGLRRFEHGATRSTEEHRTDLSCPLDRGATRVVGIVRLPTGLVFVARCFFEALGVIGEIE
jgi:hypothetical protein